MDFQGKCVIVTGSSNGIGRATAMEFARRGASVLIHGRDAQAIAETVRLCQEAGPANATFPIVKGDVTDDTIIKEIAETAIDKLGRIDVLVNNAGGGKSIGLLADIAIFDGAINLLVRAPLLLSQLCFPYLEKVKGNIVNISSITAIRPTDKGPFYSIAKCALDMFTKCGALEFGSKGVRVNSINPGVVKTNEFERGGFGNEEEIKVFLKVASDVTPLGKIGDVKEVAKVVAFFASEAASMMNGACVAHDGGWTLIGLDTKTLQNAAN